MPEDDKAIDEDALEKEMKIFFGMNDETLEAVTEVWMKEVLTRGRKHDDRKRTAQNHIPIRE